MISEFHFIRPLWFLAYLPLVPLIWHFLKQKPAKTAWSQVCDEHLLPYLMDSKEHHQRILVPIALLLGLVMMIFSLAGPTWSRMPVPTYQQIQPRVLVLDMSDAMLAHDLSPDRLSRAKFKLHDLFHRKEVGQLGLVVYTNEPFVVSPLTDDAMTIDALLSSLTPDIMPVEGQRLATALEQARTLITDAGFQNGQLLVLTASPPSADAVEVAKTLSKKGFVTSVMPIVGKDRLQDAAFTRLADAGQGTVIPLSDSSTDLDTWLTAQKGVSHYTEGFQTDFPVWRDQGRWFLIPALLLLLPAFRRGLLS